MSTTKQGRIILRTDAGEVLGRYRNVSEAEAAAVLLSDTLHLVICGDTGIVFARRFPKQASK